MIASRHLSIGLQAIPAVSRRAGVKRTTESYIKGNRQPSEQKFRAFGPSAKCAASSAQAAGTADGDSDGWKQVLLLGALFAGWYAFNIVFNIYNKQVLTAMHFPMTATAYQFLMGSALGGLWFLASGTRVALTKATLMSVLPLAVVHTLGNLLTNMSLGMVAVSFTHTIKAMEPIFSVILSAMFLGDRAHPLVLATLLPIMGGVVGASFSEASFNWPGFASAMGSNLTFQGRNVLSKKCMTPDLKDRVGGSIGLFSLITMLSFVLLMPLAVLVEGVKFTPAAMRACGVADPLQIAWFASIAAFTFHSYQQLSYMILARVSPVTHSIGNCIKRVIVIVASVIVFQNPMSMQSKISTMVALAGVFAYSQAKRVTKEKPVKASALPETQTSPAGGEVQG